MVAAYPLHPSEALSACVRRAARTRRDSALTMTFSGLHDLVRCFIIRRVQPQKSLLGRATSIQNDRAIPPAREGRSGRAAGGSPK